MSDTSDLSAAIAAMNRLLNQNTKTKAEDTDYDNKELLKYVVNTKIEKDKPKESLIKEIDENEDIPPMPDNWPWDYPRWKDYCKRNNITNKDNVNDLEIKSEYVIRDGFGREIKRYDPVDRIASEYIGKPKNKENVEAMLKDITDEVSRTDPRVKVRTETDELGNHRVILKDLDGDDYEVTDSGFVKLVKKQEEMKDRTKVDVAGVIEALMKIRDKFEERSTSYEDNRTKWKCNTYISELLYLIRNPDHLETRMLKKFRNKTTNNVLSFLDTADKYLNPDELMIIFFGIYFVWVMCKDKIDKEDDGLQTLMC